jgi:sulfite reductase alpha subunit-like flavoprotein
LKNAGVTLISHDAVIPKSLGLVDLPQKTVSFASLDTTTSLPSEDTRKHPPKFVTPHPPYEVFSAPLFHARELTKPGAEKRTYHFDIDVTDYPKESGEVDFVVGGAIGVCACTKRPRSGPGIRFISSADVCSRQEGCDEDI